MAKAPTPGAKRKADQAQAGFRIVVRGDHYDFYPDQVSLAVRFRVRQETGSSLEQLMVAPGTDSFAVFVWVHRVMHGEPGLDLADVWATFESLDEDDFDVQELSPGSHPEDSADPS